MSSAPSTIRNENAIDLQSSMTAARRAIALPVRFVGFWAAVSLPFLYLPLLADGLPGAELPAFVTLLVIHVAALVVGHDHRR